MKNLKIALWIMISFQAISIQGTTMRQAILYGYADRVQELIQSGIDVNEQSQSFPFKTYLAEAIESAMNEETPARIEIIELLIQGGAKINEAIQLRDAKWTALYKVAFHKSPKLSIIRLLLGYGAKITNPIALLITTGLQSTNEELKKIFQHHLTCIKLAKSSPTQKLLLEAIGYNKPYIVNLIVKANPALVKAEDLPFAISNSPSSVKILQKALSILKFRKLACESESYLSTLPEDVLGCIESLIAHND